MKISKRQLRKIIREEKSKVLVEQRIRLAVRRYLVEANYDNAFGDLSTILGGDKAVIDVVDEYETLPLEQRTKEKRKELTKFLKIHGDEDLLADRAGGDATWKGLAAALIPLRKTSTELYMEKQADSLSAKLAELESDEMRIMHRSMPNTYAYKDIKDPRPDVHIGNYHQYPDKVAPDLIKAGQFIRFKLPNVGFESPGSWDDYRLAWQGYTHHVDAISLSDSKLLPQSEWERYPPNERYPEGQIKPIWNVTVWTPNGGIEEFKIKQMSSIQYLPKDKVKPEGKMLLKHVMQGAPLVNIFRDLSNVTAREFQTHTNRIKRY